MSLGLLKIAHNEVAVSLFSLTDVPRASVG
jgi:hypothetical protein